MSEVRKVVEKYLRNVCKGEMKRMEYANEEYYLNPKINQTTENE